MSDDLKIQACFSDVYHKLYDELSIQQFYKLRNILEISSVIYQSNYITTNKYNCEKLILEEIK